MEMVGNTLRKVYIVLKTHIWAWFSKRRLKDGDIKDR